MRKIIYVATVLAMLLNVSCEKISDMKLFKKETLQEKFNKKLPEIKEMSELSCVEYTVTKVIASDEDSKWYGDRKIIYNCRATFKVGFDLKKLKANIDENNKSIELTLPEPTYQILMPVNKIKVAYEKKTGIRSNYSNDERLKIKQLGQESIEKEIPKMGAYEEAKKNAEAFFRTLLVELGFNESGIQIKYEKL